MKLKLYKYERIDGKTKERNRRETKSFFKVRNWMLQRRAKEIKKIIIIIKIKKIKIKKIIIKCLR